MKLLVWTMLIYQFKVTVSVCETANNRRVDLTTIVYSQSNSTV